MDQRWTNLILFRVNDNGGRGKSINHKAETSSVRIYRRACSSVRRKRPDRDGYGLVTVEMSVSIVTHKADLAVKIRI